VQEPGGRVHSARMDFPPGHSRNPLSDAQVDEKFTRLAGPVLRAGTGKALRALRTLETCEDLRKLTPLLVGDTR